MMLRGISVLELCLVIAMKKLTEVSGGESFNFEMVYQGQYGYLYSSTRRFSKFHAWSVLYCLGMNHGLGLGMSSIAVWV